MKIDKIVKTIGLVGVLLLGAVACDDDDTPVFTDNTTEYDMTGFAKGADVSWLTEMEREGISFYNASGVSTECLRLLRDLGVNAVRLRVWVNPADGWCNKDDVVAKAWRAHQLGMRILIDFHYSDTWADPSSQYKPSAWEDLTLEELKTAIAEHTREVLTALQAQGITPEWVQVGNEVGPGLLWDTDASVSGATYDVEEDGTVYAANTANFADFISEGSAAVRSVCPEAKVIVHLQEGDNNDLYRWIFDILQERGADYDVIGMSLYPEVDNWQTMVASCVSNMNDLASRYGKEVMICETGLDWEEAETANAFLTELLAQSKAIDACLGIFYWEPECYGGWNSYYKGAFDDEGKPTVALDAFK